VITIVVIIYGTNVFIYFRRRSGPLKELKRLRIAPVEPSFEVRHSFHRGEWRALGLGLTALRRKDTTGAPARKRRKAGKGYGIAF
jgi:hypothetical protein